jgi:hypothetical protein
MLDFRTGQILRLLMRTMPFLLLRIAVYIGITIAYVLAVGIGGGLGALFGKIGGNMGGGAGIGGLSGFVIVSGLLFWARQYLLYMVKAGHIAVLVELLDGKQIPAGGNQISFGTSIVKQHFATSSVLFGLHSLVRGILNVFNRVTISIASWLPIPGLDVLVKIVDKVINTSLSHLDLVILAQILRRQADNPWAIARDSTVLYAQNYKGVLKNAVFLTLIIWALTLLLWIGVAAPVAALVGLFHVQAGFWTLALAFIAALSIKAALIDPFATVALIQVYDKITAGQTPNPQWTAKLESVSGKFRELVDRARTNPPTAPTTIDPAPAQP